MFQLPTNCFSSSRNVSCAMEMPVFLLVKIFVFLLEKIKMFLLAEMLVFLSKKIQVFLLAASLNACNSAEEILVCGNAGV